MIRLDDLCALLDGLGIPWANQRFADNEEPEPPFICLVAGVSQALYADNEPWVTWMTYDVALYTRHRDYEAEGRIRAALEGTGCRTSLSITEIDSEGLTEAAFAVNVEEDEG